jgi:1-acyl-sn-glycerol-3-phosphate acyltransferase
MSLLRSVLFSTPMIALCTIVMGSISLIASFFDHTGKSQHALARVWGKMLLAVSFMRVSVVGVEKLDPNGPYVFVANHGSYMDIPALLATLPQQFRFFAKKGLYSIPFLGTHLRRAGHLPVDRSSPRASLKSMMEASRMISGRGISVLNFPEGGRSQEGLHEFKEGPAYIAIKAGVPVVPVAIVGARELLPMGSGHLKSGHIVVRVGNPIPTEGMEASQRMELTRRLHDDVSQLMSVR